MPEAHKQHPACRAHGPHGRCMYCMGETVMIKSQVHCGDGITMRRCYLLWIVVVTDLLIQDERYCKRVVMANERCYRRFEDWWVKQQYKVQRCGYLYGRFDERSGEMCALVDAVRLLKSSIRISTCVLVQRISHVFIDL